MAAQAWRRVPAPLSRERPCLRQPRVAATLAWPFAASSVHHFLTRLRRQAFLTAWYFRGPDLDLASPQELERLQQMPPAAAEYGVTRHYLDWILNLPWEKETEDKLDLAEAEKILNEQHFGLDKVKDRLLEFLAVIKRRKQIIS